MTLDFIITVIQANVIGEKEKFSRFYSVSPDDTRFWCMIDLVNSSNFRLLRGPKEGYIRGELFFSLVDNVIASSNEIWKIKEMGDAVFLTSTGFRPLFESIILINQVATKLRTGYPHEVYPFEIKSGISFGIGKKLNRFKEDFFATSIDQLSRIMSSKHFTSNLIIHEPAFEHVKKIIEEYKSFIAISEVKKLTNEDSKNMLEDILYREIQIDLKALLAYKENFSSWQK